MTRKQKWIIGLIACAVLIPLMAYASFKGNLIKWGIKSDGSNITLIDGDLRVQGGNIGITADKDLIGLAANAVTINGATIVTGNEATSGTKTITGATYLRSTLEASTTTLDALTVSGNEATSGTKTITGATYLRDTAEVTGVLDGNSTCTFSVIGEHKERILSFTSAKTLTAAMSGAIISNQDAATSSILSLPTAAAGLTYTFLDVEAAAGSDLWIKAADGDKINGGTAAKHYWCDGDAVKQHVTLVAIDDELWEVTAENGTWANSN